ncbi:3-phosphoshikimate 1-carboxyvinyltransferase [Sphingobacterium hungaricum]|uniref:3-phosphoshikimate 1-carboxyvinyltransferase n=1 Tax=Sphingobacterium hungaricum TaxID=2082723 RepID=A0A928YS52_9SPHI|nr:3-phosphoshikimate 1-carboxyvinyltransferase [Sphingobacterium hungaricum]MBE8715377.1 3-phosphoshikimate 1-carboxyvinyltransferase [Sphingobacterium hungaricum]
MNHTSITLSHPTQEISGTVQLTGSKSESNRALIIRALSKGKVSIENLSDADDTVILQNALQIAHQAGESEKIINIGPAGTAMRFLTSYLNLVEGKFVLTGTDRMKQRPIGILVDALKNLGTTISYQEKEGFPPIQITGGFKQKANSTTIKGDVSSQYISSLLLIASALKDGLRLDIEGELTSRPYVNMTLQLLQDSGIAHTWENNSIIIQPQAHQATKIYIEPDWSAASYWYSVVALSKNGRILLPGLKENSLQGDSAIVEIMTHFGVKSTFTNDGILLEKSDSDSDKKLFDFKECPDLAQTVVVIAAALKRNVSFTGLETLKIKETDRILALQNEIGKFGAKLLADGEIYHLKTEETFVPEKLEIKTYEDHRMAMAFAPLALVFKNLTIIEPQVVEKSYPDFWLHLEQQGFKITQ